MAAREPGRTETGCDTLHAGAREALRERLELLLPILRELGAAEVLDAATALLVLCAAPGSVRSAALLPLLATFDERMGELFARAAAEVTGAARAEMLDAVGVTAKNCAQRVAAMRATRSDVN